MYLRLEMAHVKPLLSFPHSTSVLTLSFAPCRRFVLYYHSSLLNTSLKKVIKQVKKKPYQYSRRV